MTSQNDSGAPLYSPEESQRIRGENYGRTQNFNQFQDAMLLHAKENHIPYKGVFELTPRCSMQCRMCYMRLDPPQIKAQGRELDTEEWIRLGRMAFEAGTLDLLLTGGEPMLRPDFAKVYTALSDMGFLLRIFTNATLVTPEILSLLRERPPQSMEITLYGASGETYRRLGGWAEGYDRAVKAVDELRGFLPSLRLKTTIIRDNAADYKALLRFAKERALSIEPTLMPIPAVRGACSDVLQSRLTVDELMAFYQEHAINISTEDSDAPDPEKRSAVFCGAGENTYTIQWNGDMVACNVDDDPARPIGRPLEEGFDAAWDKLLQFRCGKPLPAPCITCPVYALCGCCAVNHRVESGHYDRPARYVCDFYRRMTGNEPLPDEAFTIAECE